MKSKSMESILKAVFFTFLLLCLSIVILKAQDIPKKKGFLNQSGSMTERWELDSTNHKGLFLITPYKPVYITAGRYSSNPNTKPTSENPLYTQPTTIDYNNYEAKFQFSFKTKIAHKLFWDHADLWIAYTQKAHWQLYNTGTITIFGRLRRDLTGLQPQANYLRIKCSAGGLVNIIQLT